MYSFNTMAAGSGFSVSEIIFLYFSAMMECHTSRHFSYISPENTVLISATDERNHYQNFHCTGTCSDHEVRKAKALGCQRQSLKSPNLPDCMNYFRRLQEYEPGATRHFLQHATCEKLHPKRATALLGNARTLLDTNCNS